MQETLFVEKYRPKILDDCILPVSLKKDFKDIIKTGELPHLLLCGLAGTGKTTVARVLCHAMNYDCMFINASEENGIDILRNKIMTYASATSLDGNSKCVILDEADNMSAAFQPALRGVMESHSKNCRFILTCNYKQKIIQPLWSRCNVIDFHIDAKDRPAICVQMFEKLNFICQQENIKIEDPAVLAALIKKFFPDIRAMINAVQRYGASGVIDAGILTTLSDNIMNSLVSILKEKRFDDLRKWVFENSDMESSMFYRYFYDNSTKHMKPESVPKAVLLMAEYQYKAAFVADQCINTLAFLTECMASLKFKE